MFSLGGGHSHAVRKIRWTKVFYPSFSPHNPPSATIFSSGELRSWIPTRSDSEPLNPLIVVLLLSSIPNSSLPLLWKCKDSIFPCISTVTIGCGAKGRSMGQWSSCVQPPIPHKLQFTPASCGLERHGSGKRTLFSDTVCSAL